MRKLIILAGLAMAVLLVVVFVRGGWPRSVDTSPVGVVKSAIKVIESRNPETVADYFWGPAAQQMHLRMRVLYERYDSVDVENVFVTLRYKEDIVARVDASYDLVVSTAGNENTQHINIAVKLAWIEDRWLIKEAF